MLNLVILFYLADICRGLHIACSVVIGLVAIFFAIGLLALMITADYYDNASDLKERIWHWRKAIKTAVISGVIAVLITILTPTQKTVYMIAGAIIVNQTANEVISSDLYKKLYNVINDKLDYIVRNDKNK